MDRWEEAQEASGSGGVTAMDPLSVCSISNHLLCLSVVSLQVSFESKQNRGAGFSTYWAMRFATGLLTTYSNPKRIFFLQFVIENQEEQGRCALHGQGLLAHDCCPVPWYFHRHNEPNRNASSSRSLIFSWFPPRKKKLLLLSARPLTTGFAFVTSDMDINLTAPQGVRSPASHMRVLGCTMGKLV